MVSKSVLEAFRERIKGGDKRELQELYKQLKNELKKRKSKKGTK